MCIMKGTLGHSMAVEITPQNQLCKMEEQDDLHNQEGCRAT